MDADEPLTVEELVALFGIIETVCPICGGVIDEADFRANRALVAGEGAPGLMSFVAAHVEHFFVINPATGKTDRQTPDYQRNIEIFALAYATAGGHLPANFG